MADNSRPVAEPLQKSAQAAQAVRGAVKTGKAIAGAAKGAAAGGVWGAVAGFAWENRKFVGKVIIAATAVLMIPILILCMLPGIIFGGFGNSHSPADPDTPIMNSSAAIDSNLVEISTAVSCVLSEALTDTLTAIENDYAACTADGKEVINPYESSPNFNANLFVGQYCAAKNEDYAAVSVSDMESMLRSGKDKLYSYTKKEEERTVETVTTSVTVDASTGKETTTETVTTTTEKWIIYTVSYNGEAYFADEVFHLTAEQKDLADDYAYNLSLFLGDSMFQGLPAGYTTVSSVVTGPSSIRLAISALRTDKPQSSISISWTNVMRGNRMALTISAATAVGLRRCRSLYPRWQTIPLTPSRWQDGRMKTAIGVRAAALIMR